jgi:SAM-dependent methyltransferase
VTAASAGPDPRQRRSRVRRNWAKAALHTLSGRRPCPLCGGRCLPAAASWMHAHLRCRRCHLIYVADLPSQHDLIQAYLRVHLGDYQVRHKADWAPWMRHKDLTLDALGLPRWERALGQPRRALDVGCGEGRLLQVLRQRGWEAWGLELNPQLAAEGRQHGLVTVGSLEHAEQPARGHQLVVMSHLLEHLRAPLEALERVRTWLAPNGLLVVETPLRPDFDNIDHLYCFSAAALDLALRRAGFVPRSWFDYVDDNYRHHNLACLATVGTMSAV